MRLPTLALLLALPCVAHAAGLADARPKGAVAVATVTARRGPQVTITLVEAAKAKAGDLLLVGRPQLRVAVAKDNKALEFWGTWQQAGQITLRRPRGSRAWLAVVAKEDLRPGLDGKPAPNIRPGDVVYRAPAP